MSRRHTSLLTLVVAAAAVSTAAVGTITAPAHATQVAESTLSIRVPHPRIEAGDTTRVLGDLHVRGPLDPSGRTVTLEAKPQGATDFTPVGTTVSGPRGGVGLEVAPTVTTRYRWHYAGAEDARPSKSGIARVVIVADQHHGHKIHTSLSIRAAHRVVQRRRTRPRPRPAAHPRHRAAQPGRRPAHPDDGRPDLAGRSART